MGKVVHFEINAEDPERAIKFYRDVLGWKIESWGGDADYWLVTTGDEKTPGIGGAIMRSKKRGMGTYNTVEVESLKDSLEAVEKSGGKKIGDTNQIPGVGIFSYCEDTEGNIFGLLQPDKMG
jgi:predicted enzyme related to lactoylglutathione lyase